MLETVLTRIILRYAQRNLDLAGFATGYEATFGSWADEAFFHCLVAPNTNLILGLLSVFQQRALVTRSGALETTQTGSAQDRKGTISGKKKEGRKNNTLKETNTLQHAGTLQHTCKQP